MKNIIAGLLLFSVPGLAGAGALERSAFSSALVSIDLAALPSPALLPPPSPAAVVRPAPVNTPEWINAVKKAYFSYPQGGLPPALETELPAGALQQMQWDAATYPSKAYKLEVEGRTVYFIENDNFDALYVNVFDETGLNIAYGGFDENYDFYWLSKAPAAAR